MFARRAVGSGRSNQPLKISKRKQGKHKMKTKISHKSRPLSRALSTLRIITATAAMFGAASTASADSISINFESLSTGALPGGTDGRSPGNGQWWVPDNAATSGVVTAGIGVGGTQGLVIGNRGNGNDGVIDNVHSPKLSQMAGESSVPSVAASGFESSFLFRTVPTSASTGYDFKIESWGRDRTTWLSFSDIGGLLKANYSGVDSTDTFTDNFGTYHSITSLTWGAWYRVDTSVAFVDGDNNDIVNVEVFNSDDELVWNATDTTWEHYYRVDSEQAGNGNLITGVDALQFQARGNPVGDVAYVDNITYSATAVPEPSTWGMALGGIAMLFGTRRLGRRSVLSRH
jgi:hypothetical protein